MAEIDTYPIHPGMRLIRRLKTVLAAMASGEDAFTGLTIREEYSGTDTEFPFIALKVEESIEKPPRSETWHCTATATLVEERAEANTVLSGGDARTRHEWRHENISARLFGRWDSERLIESITGVADSWELTAFKQYGGAVSQTQEDADILTTTYTFTVICSSTSL